MRLKEVISAERIANRVKELGERITADYVDKDLVVVANLKGSFMFLADLVRQIDLPIQIDFIATASYSGTKSTGVVRIVKDLKLDVVGKHLLIVEDIVDTGLTLEYLLEYMKIHKPASIRSCALLDKPDRRKVEVSPDYVGFVIPDKFVVGYGLDYDERFRNLKYIAELEL